MSQTKAELIEPQGNVAFDTNTLYVDAGNNRVGIGTTTVNSLLEVRGTTDGQNVLHLSNSAGTSDGNVENQIRVTCGGNTYWGNLDIQAYQTIFTQNGGEKARIDPNGRLLVGTSSSSANASIVCQGTSGGSAGAAQLWLQRGQAASGIVAGETLGRINFADNAGNLFAWIDGQTDGTAGTNDYPSRLVFSTTADGASSPTERMRITNQGWTQLVSASDGYLAATTAAAGTSTEVFRGTHSATAGSQNSGTISIRIYNNGNIQNTNNSYGALSDIKLKENIIDANSQWSDIKALQVRNYKLKEGQTHTQIGLIAQEVELVSPGLVSESPDRDEDGNDLGTVTKSVNYSVLYMKAVKALQEAMERIETLEAKVAALESA